MPFLLPVSVFKAFCGFYASHSLIVLSWDPDAKSRSDVGSQVMASTELSCAGIKKRLVLSKSRLTFDS